MALKIRKNQPRKKTMAEVDKSTKPYDYWQGKKKHALLPRMRVKEIRRLIAEIDAHIEVWRDLRKARRLKRKKQTKK